MGFSSIILATDKHYNEAQHQINNSHALTDSFVDQLSDSSQFFMD
jgi:hypothetical protein